MSTAESFKTYLHKKTPPELRKFPSSFLETLHGSMSEMRKNLDLKISEIRSAVYLSSTEKAEKIHYLREISMKNKLQIMTLIGNTIDINRGSGVVSVDLAEFLLWEMEIANRIFSIMNEITDCHDKNHTDKIPINPYFGMDTLISSLKFADNIDDEREVDHETRDMNREMLLSYKLKGKEKQIDFIHYALDNRHILLDKLADIRSKVNEQLKHSNSNSSPITLTFCEYLSLELMYSDCIFDKYDCLDVLNDSLQDGFPSALVKAADLLKKINLYMKNLPKYLSMADNSVILKSFHEDVFDCIKAISISSEIRQFIRLLRLDGGMDALGIEFHDIKKYLSLILEKLHLAISFIQFYRKERAKTTERIFSRGKKSSSVFLEYADPILSNIVNGRNSVKALEQSIFG